MSKRYTFTFTDEQNSELLKRAKEADCAGDTDRELIYQYLCRREGFEPVQHGGRREEAIAATVAYRKKATRGKK